MSERVDVLLGGKSSSELAYVSPSEVLAEYERANQAPLENIRRMIGLYPNWHCEALTPGEVGQLIWYFDPKNPDHISWKLTQSGRARRVEQVARAYLRFGPESLAREWEEVFKVEAMIESLRRGERLPALIIVSGSRYSDSPDSSFIDGIHRALAIVIYTLRTRNSDLEVDAYVGQKASLLARAVRRLNQR